MARCGCASATCSCLVTGGDNVEVTGAGSVNNPYVINVDAVDIGGVFQVVDTASVDLSLGGEGTTEEPYQLSAAIKCDAVISCVQGNIALDDLSDVTTAGGTEGYVLAQQADGSFALVPPVTAEPGAINTDASLDGDGSSANPLAVHDYEWIAWLNPADNVPNLGSLTLGSEDSANAYTYSIDRMNSPGNIIGVDYTTFEMGIDSGAPSTGYLGQLSLKWDGVNQSFLRFYPDGRLTNHGGPVNNARPIPYSMCTGRGTIVIPGTIHYANRTVTFPSGRFSEPPIVTISGNVGNIIVSIQTITETSMTYWVRDSVANSTGADREVIVNWIAVQMTPTNQVG